MHTCEQGIIRYQLSVRASVYVCAVVGEVNRKAFQLPYGCIF